MYSFQSFHLKRLFAIPVVSASLFVFSGLMGCENDTSVMKPAIAKLVEEAKTATADGNMDVARCRLQSALSLQPDHPKVAYNLAVLESQDHRWEEAIAYYQLVLVKEPENANVLYGLVVANQARAEALVMREAAVKNVAMRREALPYYEACQTNAEQFLSVAAENDEGRADVTRIASECAAGVKGLQ